MDKYLNNENSVVEFQKIVNLAEEFQAELDEYCTFMKQTFLATSGLN